MILYVHIFLIWIVCLLYWHYSYKKYCTNVLRKIGFRIRLWQHSQAFVAYRSTDNLTLPRAWDVNTIYYFKLLPKPTVLGTIIHKLSLYITVGKKYNFVWLKGDVSKTLILKFLIFLINFNFVSGLFTKQIYNVTTVCQLENIIWIVGVKLNILHWTSFRDFSFTHKVLVNAEILFKLFYIFLSQVWFGFDIFSEVFKSVLNICVFASCDSMIRSKCVRFLFWVILYKTI